MTRSLTLLLTLTLLPLAACKKAETSSPDDATPTSNTGHEDHAGGEDEFAGRDVVDNWSAQPGDVTVCPISGKKFEVKEDSGRFAYQGYEFVFCCAGKCLEQVEADPGKFLDALVEEAGGPATDPDPADGGAIDDA